MAHLDNNQQFPSSVAPENRNKKMRQDEDDTFVRKRNYETAMFSIAANFPMTRVYFPSVSTYIPCFATIMYYLNSMDILMASTKSWTDDCYGWVPPYSQIYISMLLYIQVMRAMELAGCRCRDLSVLKTIYPLEDLMVPGPLVCAFYNLCSFLPFASGKFGKVTPYLPSKPGWSRDRTYAFTNSLCTHLPNVSVFMSRLHSICGLALQDDMTDALFQNHVSGPQHISVLFERDCDHNAQEALLVSSPGAGLAYPGNLRLWREAAYQLNNFNMPGDFNQEHDNVANNWIAALRLDDDLNWFGPVAAMMAKYCQYWHGSIPLSSCQADGSAAGSLICLATLNSSILASPQWHNTRGDGSTERHGDPNCVGHYTLRSNPTLTFQASTCINDIPDANVRSALTYQFNMMSDNADMDLYLKGKFWTVQPPAFSWTDIQVYQGTVSTIAREYHSDIRLQSDD